MMNQEEQIRMLMNRVGETFSNLDFDGWINCFHTSHSFVHETVFSSSSYVESKAHLYPMFENMEARGLKRTDLNLCNIKMLTATTALVSTVWSRIDKNEILMEQFGATYLVVLDNGEWKIALVTGHAPDVVVVNV